MRNNTVVTKQETVGNNAKIKLDYSLIITDRKIFDLFDQPNVYSVLILQIENGITTEYDFLYDVARDEAKAVELLDLLVYNNVMPHNARDVLADIL